MEKADCGRGFVSSLFTVTALSAGAYLCYRMARNLITFCAVFDAPVPAADGVCADELEECILM
ncbi:MAG: hypothetical protein IJC99_06460 [Clostridia bacterium]|nr:hypothetical protein [Clostridia bacterium]